MATLHLEIISPDGIIYSDEIDEVLLPAQNGQIAILPHHAPLFSKLTEGEVIIKKGGKENFIAIIGGFLEVQNNKAHIISDYAIRAESIEIAKAQEAKRRAQKILQEKKEYADFAIVENDLRKSILELKVAEKLRRRRQ